MKKLTLLLVVCLATVALQAQKFGNAAMQKLNMAEFAITNLYVDTVNENKLVEGAIISMLEQLDPHSKIGRASCRESVLRLL